MPKPDAKTKKPQPIVTLSITTGPISPAQRQLAKKFWTRIIGTVQNELKAEEEAKHG